MTVNEICVQASDATVLLIIFPWLFLGLVRDCKDRTGFFARERENSLNRVVGLAFAAFLFFSQRPRAAEIGNRRSPLVNELGACRACSTFAAWLDGRTSTRAEQREVRRTRYQRFRFARRLPASGAVSCTRPADLWLCRPVAGCPTLKTPSRNREQIQARRREDRALAIHCNTSVRGLRRRDSPSVFMRHSARFFVVGLDDRRRW